MKMGECQIVDQKMRIVLMKLIVGHHLIIM